MLRAAIVPRGGFFALRRLGCEPRDTGCVSRRVSRGGARNRAVTARRVSLAAAFAQPTLSGSRRAASRGRGWRPAQVSTRTEPWPPGPPFPRCHRALAAWGSLAKVLAEGRRRVLALAVDRSRRQLSLDAVPRTGCRPRRRNTIVPRDGAVVPRLGECRAAMDLRWV